MLTGLFTQFIWFAPRNDDANTGKGRARPAGDANAPIPAREPVEQSRVPPIIAGVDQTILLQDLRSSDPAVAERALTTIYEALFPSLWRVAYRALRTSDLAEDVVQDVFVRLWRQRTTVTVRGALTLYLHVAVRNTVNMQLRHKKVVDRHAQSAVDAEGFAAAVYVGTVLHPAEALAETEAESALWQALHDVSPRDRDILVLRWHEGWSFDDIGQALGISSVAARVVVSRQQRRLGVYLDQLREELKGR